MEQLAALDGVIAGAREAAEDADEAEAQATQRAPANATPQGQEGDDGDDGEDFAEFYTVPASPAGYELPTQLARDRGLAVDSMAEIELRKSLHAAGVDDHMATMMYYSALNAHTTGDLSPVGQETAYRAAAHALHRAWGKDYEGNLALAKAEARRVFEALPRSVTGGASFAEFARASGMANSRLLVEQL
ncbi:MAG: hypothetical protein IPG91_11210 [Ideonella sp.]|nr:hypothetical protein [Ideonella sp.]